MNSNKISACYKYLLSLTAVMTAIIGMVKFNWGAASEFFAIENMSLLISIFVCAFLFEILCLAIIDRIGLEEKLYAYSGMVIKTYGLMGIAAAFALCIFGLCHHIAFLSACATITIAYPLFAIFRRDVALSSV